MPAYYNSTLGEPWYQENAAPLTNVAATAYATSVSVNNPGDSLIVFLRKGLVTFFEGFVVIQSTMPVPSLTSAARSATM